MILHTASEVISLSEKLETVLADFYENLSKKYDKDKLALLAFAKENRNNVKQITRAYQEVITDAIEGCFAFNMNADDYALVVEPLESESYSRALSKAVEMEEFMSKFYADAAEQSKTLLADVPRSFAVLARKRPARISELRSLISK